MMTTTPCAELTTPPSAERPSAQAKPMHRASSGAALDRAALAEMVAASESSGAHSNAQLLAQAFIDSIHVTTFVLVVVAVQLGVLSYVSVDDGFLDEGTGAFEIGIMVFFVVEIAFRIWAHNPYYFFCGYQRSWLDISRWLNSVDFLISFVDVLTLSYEAASGLGLIETTATLSTDSGRLLRFLRMSKYRRAARGIHLVR